MAKKKQSTPLSQEAIVALRRSDYAGNTFTLPDEHLECYGEIKSLMAALGGKWVGKRKRMEFGEGVDCRALVMAACDRGEIPPSNPMDFFPTPADAVAEILALRWLEEKWQSRIVCAEFDERPVRYLEPSGGSGALAAAIVARMRPQDELVIVEMNPLLADLLRSRFPQATVVEADFLTYTPEAKFDIILMNPPFDGKAYRKHVLHAEGMLTRLGVLAAIVPSTFIGHGMDFVYHVTENGQWHDLGGERFEGTDVATSVLFLDNDPDNLWRERPCHGYSTHHAWETATTIANDGDLVAKLNRAEDFAAAVCVLRDWADALVKGGSCIRVDESIAREALISAAGDHDVLGLAHLVSDAPVAAAEVLSSERERADEVAPTCAMQGELALA